MSEWLKQLFCKHKYTERLQILDYVFGVDCIKCGKVLKQPPLPTPPQRIEDREMITKQEWLDNIPAGFVIMSKDAYEDMRTELKLTKFNEKNQTQRAIKAEYELARVKENGDR